MPYPWQLRMWTTRGKETFFDLCGMWTHAIPGFWSPMRALPTASTDWASKQDRAGRGLFRWLFTVFYHLSHPRPAPVWPCNSVGKSIVIKTRSRGFKSLISSLAINTANHIKKVTFDDWSDVWVLEIPFLKAFVSVLWRRYTMIWLNTSNLFIKQFESSRPPLNR